MSDIPIPLIENFVLQILPSFTLWITKGHGTLLNYPTVLIYILKTESKKREKMLEPSSENFALASKFQKDS